MKGKIFFNLQEILLFKWFPASFHFYFMTWSSWVDFSPIHFAITNTDFIFHVHFPVALILILFIKPRDRQLVCWRKKNLFQGKKTNQVSLFNPLCLCVEDLLTLLLKKNTVLLKKKPQLDAPKIMINYYFEVAFMTYFL